MAQEFPVVTEARPSALVTVYWRPGCPYCRRLRQDLRRIGLPAREINIWEDRSAAETVRSVAGGNETVPTVVVGDRAMVNPPASAVVEEVRRLSPGFAAETGITRVAQRLYRKFETIRKAVRSCPSHRTHRQHPPGRRS